jgi:hypothetical protein
LKPKDQPLVKASQLGVSQLGAPPEIFERMKLITGSYGSRPPREQLDYPYPERI